MSDLQGFVLDKKKLATHEGWKEFYDMNFLPWQDEEFSEDLVEHLDELLSHAHKKNSPPKDVRFFLPCSGTSLDLLFLYQKGFTVIGCDCVEASAELFFSDKKLKCVKDELTSNFKRYQTEDKRLQLYIGDIFDLTPELIGGTVDCIWDSRAMAAVDVSFREKYRSTIERLVNPNFGYLLEGYDRQNPEEQPNEMPHTLNYEQVLELYPKYLVQLILQENLNKPGVPTEWPERVVMRNLYLIMPKDTERLDHWTKAWAIAKIGWHRQVVNPHLEKHYEMLTDGKTDLTFFFPLCGKTKDMQWVYQKGHKVVGVEAVATAVQQFFDESEIEHSVEELKELEGWLYKSKDERIKIFVCDLFKITPQLIGSSIDVVFDRGCYVALYLEDRKPYISLMLQLYSPGTKHLMVTTFYDKTKHNGPPRCVDKEEVPTFYSEVGQSVGKIASVEIIGSEVVTENLERFNLKEMTEINILIVAPTK